MKYFQNGKLQKYNSYHRINQEAVKSVGRDDYGGLWRLGDEVLLKLGTNYVAEGLKEE